jgi:metal-responsive CopG/Arc/MetJ family transcriptional regulator
MSSLHRTQIMLEKWHYEYLKNTAERQDKSLSEIIRNILSQYINESDSAQSRLKEIAGIGVDEEACGRDHDRWLYGKGQQ